MSLPTNSIVAVLNSHGTRIYAVLMRLTLRHDVAEDLIQELFITLSRSNSFAKARNPGAYAVQSAIHLAMNWRKTDSRENAQGLQSSNERCSNLSPVDTVIERDELDRLLEQLNTLPERDRLILIMHYLQQESFDSIAELYQKTPHQIRGLCHKAIVKLRKLMNSDVSRNASQGRVS